ncbi:hypothetical protein FFL01_21410 [Flavobacterium flevense]|uniref:DUF1735 domain-containing protein n=1 Tax=Flavobacterium flevense TaxID=983 RepID=A0A4Y4AZN4_9FLAO|nr:hypothetical protein FFL01_21410 [Flavobacterium flevense]
MTFGCENGENEFEDFDTQNVYFPIQYPVRTISLLEDSRIDNSIDLQKSFNIGVAVGGLRNNSIDRKVTIAVAPELVQNVTTGGVPVLLMPSNYYTLASNEITIPAGSFSGTVKVQLTDAFFNDPLAVKTTYVIPLVIVSSNTTGILSGVPVEGVVNPDRRISEHWQANFKPKDFTLFAVKYINKYQGKYLHKGKDDTLDAGGAVVSSDVYSTQYLEQNILTDLFTVGLSKSTMNRIGKSNATTSKMDLTFGANGAITISTATGGLSVNGTGKFIARDEEGALTWGGESRKTLILDYTYTAGTVNHHVKDTLVFRNDELKFEEFSIVVNNP